MIPSIAVGQLVVLPLSRLEMYGVVEHCDSSHVRVQWEDGTTGLLYWDHQMEPCAFSLQVAR